MNTPQNEFMRRRRAVDAMGLGPLWVLRSRPVVHDRPAADRPATIAAMDGDELAEAVRTCRACPLCESRTQAVFGEGSADVQWFVVGVAPSVEDDRVGAPLTGQAGRLLDAMLASVDRSRQRDVFVTTAVKCRPPHDRAPSQAEIETCRPYLDRQIALMAPRLLVALGDPASRALSPSPPARGEVGTDERGLPMIATHDPATLLAEPRLKAQAWADLCGARSVRIEPDPVVSDGPRGSASAGRVRADAGFGDGGA